MALPTGIFVHNWRLKLTALGLAVLLWAVAQTDRNSETVPGVPVIIEMGDTMWAPSGVPDPSVVELRMSGPAREIIRLAREGTFVRVVVGQVVSADTVISLRRDMVVLGEGSGLSVESMSPATVRVAFEPAETRVVPISVRTRGVLPDQLALASPIGVNPGVVRVRGPASRVAGVDSVPLRPLDLGTVVASGVFEVAVDTSVVRGVRVVPGSATVGIRVEEEMERTLGGVPVVVAAEAGESTFVVSPSAVSVILRGARTLVMAVDPADLRAWVAPETLQGMAPGEERRVPVRVEGVPDLVSSAVPEGMVTVRRSADADERPDGSP